MAKVKLDRVTQQPDVMGGKACIRGMRVTVGMVLSQIGAGHSVEDVLAHFPYWHVKTSCTPARTGLPIENECVAKRAQKLPTRTCCTFGRFRPIIVP